MYGIEVAAASPKTIGNLTAAVIDVFNNKKNNSHNANQFFSTISKSKSDLDPAAQIFARRVMQVRRTTCKKAEAGARFQKLLRLYAENTNAASSGRNGTGKGK